jgi:photosystem II stability/assembly factor-like uncharacterized protein
MNGPDLETTIRSYYRTFEPDNSTLLALASARVLEDARRPKPKRFAWTSLRLAATAVGAAVLLAVLVVPRLGPAVGPAPGTTAPGPTFDATAAVSAQVDGAGLIRSGGIWAVQGSYLLTSTDNGVSWQAGTFPVSGGAVAAATVFVLDPEHAWAIDSGSSAGLPLDVVRTSDGGRTWQSTPVSGNFRCDSATLSFVNADRGFLMCSYGSTSGPNGSNNEVRTQATKGSGTVLRTGDGGATWSVAGSATGLGSQFTASDANTLWSAPDYDSSFLTGPTLYVSRDAGVSWSVDPLPEMPAAPLPAAADVRVAAGPVFWDASNGAVAISVYVWGSTNQSPAVWFYRTSDAGRSWTLVKQPTELPAMGGPQPVAVVGKVWAAIGIKGNGFFGMSESTDFGSSWADVPGNGMPENTSFIWVDFADKSHALATVFSGPGTRALMLSSDGGRNWHAADFGDARAKVPADATHDPATAKNLANDFAVMASKDPPTAWAMLSPYSQQTFGSESEFAAAEAALNKRGNYQYQVGDPTKIAGLSGFSQTLRDDLTRSADMSRAYLVAVSFPGTSEPVVPSEALVVAPLAATGQWRVWAPKL